MGALVPKMKLRSSSVVWGSWLLTAEQEAAVGHQTKSEVESGIHGTC